MRARLWFGIEMLLAGVSAGAVPAPGQARGAPLESYLDQSRRDWQVAGLAVAVVRGDSIVFARGFGRRDARSAEAVDPETVFSIGSMTKLFTAVAAGILVDDAKMGWDEPL